MKGLVVCPEPLAANAGSDILGRGGTALEAAVAAALVQCVVNPLLCGIGGTALMLHYDAGSRRSRVINGEVAIGSIVPSEWPSRFLHRTETIGRYAIRGDENQMGHNSVMVPGLVAACWNAWESGSQLVSWEDLLTPAQDLAAAGFTVDPYISRYWEEGVGSDAVPSGAGYPDLRTKLSGSEPAQATYLRNGFAYRSGDTLKQVGYARTLRLLASRGGNDFYRGEIANEIARDMSAHSGALTSTDLAAYEAIEQLPATFTFGRYEIMVPPAPSMGPQLAAMLNVLGQLHLEGKDPTEPIVIDILARIMRSVLAATRHMKATPIEESETVSESIMSMGWAQSLARRVAAGDRLSTAPNGLHTGTTHVTAVDERGNVASMTHSIGSVGGSGSMTPKLGFLYNNFLGHFNPIAGHPDSIIPGRRMGSGCPLIVFEEGVPVLAAGAPGGSRIVTSLFQVLSAVLVWKMPLGQALALPRFHSEEGQLIVAESALPAGTANALVGLGNEIRTSDYTARVQAIAIQDGQFVAGADPRGGSASSR